MTVQSTAALPAEPLPLDTHAAKPRKKGYWKSSVPIRLDMAQRELYSLTTNEEIRKFSLITATIRKKSISLLPLMMPLVTPRTCNRKSLVTKSVRMTILRKFIARLKRITAPFVR